jgi:hypothetical protein
MLPFLSVFLLAQTPTPAPTPAPEKPQSEKPQEVLVPQEVRSLPGSLDAIPTFNSNSPELISSDGILLSTFPPQGKKTPEAHLNFGFRGRFDMFLHHVAKAENPDKFNSLYLGVILHNPGKQPVSVNILQAASYLTQPDAPFNDLAPWLENPDGAIYAGPGSRAMDTILRGRRPQGWPDRLVIAPGESQMLMNLPIIESGGRTSNYNGRSTLLMLRSSGAVYAASLSMLAKPNPDGSERPPSLADWQQLLEQGRLATPRDRPPTPLDQTKGSRAYGRVAGVAQGSRWRTQLTDQPGQRYLTIPEAGKAFSYGLSTLIWGTLGTEQVQSAPMLVRYPDTAYQAHGNYAIAYDLTLPLRNPTSQPQTVTLTLQTPIKQDQLQGGLKFLEPVPKQVFFRGTVRVRYPDQRGLPQTRYVHLVQRRGQQGEPLSTILMPPGSQRLVQVSFLYPPDSTPPQVLTIKTLEGSP